MVRKITLLLGLVLLALAYESAAQKKWVPEIELLKMVQSGGVPSAAKWIDGSDSITIVGAFDSAFVLNPDGTVNYKVPNLKNTVKKVSGVWKNAGNAVLNADQYSENSSLYSHSLFGNENYVGGEDYYSPFKKLNPVTNIYEAVPGLTFTLYYSTYPRFIYDWGGTRILLYSFPGGSGSNTINGEVFRNAAIWDRQTNAVEHTHSVYGQEGIDGKSIFAADTLFVYNGFAQKVFFIKKGTNTWSELIPTPAAHQACWLGVINGKKYIIAGGIGTIGNYDFKYFLYRLDGASWTKLLELDPAGVYDYSSNPIAGVVYRNGIFYIAGAFAKADGKNVMPIIAYDESKDSAWDAAPLPAPLNGLSRPGLYLQGLYLVGNEIFLPTTVGTVDKFWGQTVFVLKGTPPSAPSITGLVGLTNHISLSDSGVTSPGVLVDYYVNDMKAQTVQADTNGKWKATFIAGADGTYERYAKARDVEGNVSAASSILRVTVDATPPAVPTLISPADEIVLKRFETGSFEVGNIEAGAKVIFLIGATGLAYLQYQDTISSVSGTATLKRSFTESLGYEWTAVQIDAAGNVSQSPPQRIFTVTTITGIEDPDDPNKIISLYPNPASRANRVRLTNINKVFVYDAAGRLVSSWSTPKGESEIFFQTPVTAGIYYLLCETEKKKKITLKLLVK